jgi:hypothetical protein
VCMCIAMASLCARVDNVVYVRVGFP